MRLLRLHSSRRLTGPSFAGDAQRDRLVDRMSPLAEAGGRLVAITLRATVGGFLFDRNRYQRPSEQARPSLPVAALVAQKSKARSPQPDRKMDIAKLEVGRPTGSTAA